MKTELTPQGYSDLFRWLLHYPTLHPRVHAGDWKELHELYQQPVTYYDPDGSFGHLNLRHVTHPATNLSEVRVASEMYYMLGDSVDSIDPVRTLSGQKAGYDLTVKMVDGSMYYVNVKLATITNELRGFIIADATRKSLKHIPNCQVAFVDNINERWILTDSTEVADACYINNFPCGQGKSGIFYDHFGIGYGDVVRKFHD